MPQSYILILFNLLNRKNLDSGKTYILKEATGEHIRCDSRGMPIKPFDPKITGRYNYEERKQAIIRSKADLSPVPVPIQLKLNLKRNYVPQHQRLDGYAQMPRMIVPPY